MRAQGVQAIALTIFLFLLTPACVASQPKGGQARVYSDVHYVEDAGDLYGFELTLIREGGSIEATLKYYQGNNRPDVDHLRGPAVRNEGLTLSGEGRDGRVEVNGREKGGRFVGKVTYFAGRHANHFDLSLPLKR